VKWILIAALLAAGCQEPPKTWQYESAVTGLAHLHTWDPVMEAKGHYAYDHVMSLGDEVVKTLITHLADETPTAIYDELSGRKPTVGDICFLMLLHITHHPPEEFFEDGVFISTALPNPVFCVKWKDRAAKARVQAHFTQLTAPKEDDQ
jgi:hypothetical protein